MRQFGVNFTHFSMYMTARLLVTVSSNKFRPFRNVFPTKQEFPIGLYSGENGLENPVEAVPSNETVNCI